jgi:hypothetical protein
MPIDSYLPQADPFSLVPTFKVNLIVEDFSHIFFAELKHNGFVSGMLFVLTQLAGWGGGDVHRGQPYCGLLCNPCYELRSLSVPSSQKRYGGGVLFCGGSHLHYMRPRIAPPAASTILQPSQK